jgi:HPt (histidine-containing phosphotransfer) domain-containing protein
MPCGSSLSSRVCQKAPVVKSSLPLDYDRALEEFNMDNEVLDEILASFIQMGKKQIVSMEDALLQGDAEVVRREAHKIKGGASNLVALPLAKAAEHLEHCAENGHLEEAAKALEKLREEYSGLSIFFSSHNSINVKF